MSTEKVRFWYSEHQKQWGEYLNRNPLFCSVKRPSHGSIYAVIDGCLVEYTEMSSNPEYDGPNFDDAVFLGYGEYACNDWNIQTYLRRHPEVRFKSEEWPEVIFD